MTLSPAEINRLWAKLYPHRRAAYAREFAALRAGTSLGEIERKQRAARKGKRNAEPARKGSIARFLKLRKSA